MAGLTKETATEPDDTDLWWQTHVNPVFDDIIARNADLFSPASDAQDREEAPPNDDTTAEAA